MKEQDLGHGRKIIGFDSAEEMFAYMAEREAELAEEMKHLTEPQKGIGYGQYVLRMTPVGEEEPLAIFGYIYTKAEFRELELAAGANPNDGELDFIMERLQSAYDRGYRYGNWFSVACPEGEPGDSPLTTLWPITEADYQHALNNGWEMPAYLVRRVHDEIEENRRNDDISS